MIVDEGGSHNLNQENQTTNDNGEVCKYFMENRCRFGSRCKNSHPKNVEKGVEYHQHSLEMMTAAMKAKGAQNMETMIDVVVEATMEAMLKARNQKEKDEIGKRLMVIMDVMKEMRVQNN